VVGLRKLPIVSFLLAAMMIAAPFWLAREFGTSSGYFELVQEEARSFFERHPELDVGPQAELILDPVWVAEVRDAQGVSDLADQAKTPARLRARSQSQLDALIADAHAARMAADPAWRFGVLDGQTPSRNFFAHSFVHDALAGVLLCVSILLLVGAPLERTWGSIVFTAFVASAIPATAEGFRLLDGSSGVPWSGGAGLAGALLGAYFIRGLGGHFVLPGWVLLPAWMGAEAFFIRGFWFDDLGSMPWATLFAAIGFGALVAGTLRLIDLESKFSMDTDSASKRGPNPVVSRAARLRTDGDPHQAFDLIEKAWRDDPRDGEVAEAFFAIAVEVGRPAAAGAAILPSLKTALRSGDMERAVEIWLPLARVETEIELEPTAAVRLGEALLDAGHSGEALFSLRQAIDAGASGPLATRIVRVSRDLDEALTRRAAMIALSDDSLDPATRAELEPMATPSGESSAVAGSGESAGLTQRRMEAEHRPVETTAFPVEADTDLPASDPNEQAVAAQALDQGALSEDQLTAETASGDGAAAPAPEDGDVLSHWNDPSVVEGLEADKPLDFGNADLFTGDDLDLPESELESGPFVDPGDPAEAETDTDMTPLMDVTDALPSPVPGGIPADALVEPVATPLVASPESEARRPDPSSSSDDFAIGVEAAAPAPRLRLLKVLTAVPTELTDEGIEVDVDERGKSNLPYGRIDAISMAAVSGITARPVLLVDLMLNWSSASDQPLKVIRLRSDRFDPRRFEPGASDPLQALTALVHGLVQRSGGACLPSQEVVTGSFQRFDSLDAYERDVLLGFREV